MGLVYFLFRYLTKLYVFNNQLLDLFIYKPSKGRSALADVSDLEHLSSRLTQTLVGHPLLVDLLNGRVNPRHLFFTERVA
jgi:hypothetical protein